jgi:hypothetical protein
MADENKALVPAVPAEILQPTDSRAIEKTFDDIVLDAQRRAKLVQLAEYAVAHTIPEHWVELHGTPYLRGDGARWVARLIGISYEPVVEPKGVRSIEADDDGAYYVWTFWVKATLELTGDSVIEVGTCSSRDDFFASYNSGGKKQWRSPRDVDEADIKTTAYTNAVSRAVKALLGIGVMPKDKIEKLRGTGFQAGASVTFDSSGKKALPRARRKTQGQPAKSDHAKAPTPPKNGKWNRNKAIVELRRFLFHEGVCRSQEEFNEFVAYSLELPGFPPEGQEPRDAMELWSESDFATLRAAAQKIIDKYAANLPS